MTPVAATAAGSAVPAPALPDLDGWSATTILAWALAEYSPRIAVACSMQDAVVVDLAVRLDPAVEVFFLDTGFHFADTYATAARLRRRYGLNLVHLRPEAGAPVPEQAGCDACCAARKVRPMTRYLEGKDAWVTGLRRSDGPTRAGARAVEWDARHGLVKVNPIVEWSDADVAAYIAEHDVVVNPLLQRGYDSIGCEPCTVPGRGREGRWAGSGKTECGLHAPLAVVGRPSRIGGAPPRGPVLRRSH
jgi:phosphoadenosine phosphosulfate reductase